MSEHSLGLFRASEPQQPRDRHGRFKPVRYSATWLAVLNKASEMRAAAGLPVDYRLIPFGNVGAPSRGEASS